MQFLSKSLVQEFITNPFLFGKRKVSFGIFVAFSSTRPLRAYVLDKHVITRTCSKPYDPANFSDPLTYVTDGMENGNGQNMVEIINDEEVLINITDLEVND